MDVAGGCSTSECPTSLITVESIQILDEFIDAKVAYRAFGVSPYGPDARKWPAYFTDAASVLTQAENEANRIESGP